MRDVEWRTLVRGGFVDSIVGGCGPGGVGVESGDARRWRNREGGPLFGILALTRAAVGECGFSYPLLNPC